MSDADGSYTVLRLREKKETSAEILDHEDVQLENIKSNMYCFSIKGDYFAYMAEYDTDRVD